MPADLSEVNGNVAFVYNQQRGNPWHHLGQPIQGDMTMAGALRFSQSNDDVVLQPVYVLDEDGDPIQVPDLCATVSDIYGPMGVVGENWVPQQRSEMVQIAYDIAGLAGEDAHVDTMGNLGKNGQRFFAYIRFPEMVLDPEGIADVIERGLFVGTGFDGSMANTFGYTPTRPVCANTVRVALQNLQMAVKVKHTANAEERMHQAAAAMGYAHAVERQLEQKLQEMLEVQDGRKALRATLDALWPIEDDLADRFRQRREDTHDRIWDLYLGPTCADGVGENGWAAYNAVTEWLDHDRTVKAKPAEAQRRRYQQTLVDTEHAVNTMKVKAAEVILASA